MSDMLEYTAGVPLDPCDAGNPPPRLKLAAPGAALCATPQLVTLIGTRRDCHVPINRPEVSKVHCAIIQTGRGYLACDLCTRTGTFVNGAPIHVAPLIPGDQLRVGPVEVAFELTAQPPEAPHALPTTVAIRLDGHAFDLAQTALVVGRRGTCDLVLDTPDVSLAHALVFAYRAQPVVFDLGSRSGTFVNGRHVHLAPLRHGDRLSIGGVDVRVECPAGAADEDPPDRLAAVPAGDDPQRAAASPDQKLDARDPDTPVQCSAAADDLAEARRQLERRALELERRAAELDSLANVLALESEHLEQLKADCARRQAEIDRAETEARERLALAVTHEQAVTAAWEELDRWHAQCAQNAGAAPGEACAAPSVPDRPETGAFMNVAQPYPAPAAIPPAAPRAGNV